MKPRPSDAESTEKRVVRVLVVWTSLARSSEGGYTFARGLSRTLCAADTLDVTLVLPNNFDVSSLTGTDETKVLSVLPLSGLARILRDVLLLHRWASCAAADVVLVPHEWASWVRSAKVVNVIQNVLYLHPEGKRLHPSKGKLMHGLARLTSRWVDHSIAVSRTAADLWRDTTGLESIVLAEGVDEEFETVDMKSPGSITIMTGDLSHKNSRLAGALCEALHDHPCVGRIEIIGATVETASASHQTLATPELAKLFARTQLVVITSTVESFGLPAFEARAAGSSVIVAAGTPMDEWLRDDPYVTAVDGTDAASWTAAALAALAETAGVRASNLSFAWRDIGPKWISTIGSLASDETAKASDRR